MTDVAWLAPLEMKAWHCFLATTAHLLDRLDDELMAASGLSLGDYEILANLAESPGGCMRMTDLAGRVLVSRSGLTRRVDRLASEGLVARRSCESDRRGVFAELTPTGRDRLVAAAPTHVEGVRRHFIEPLGDERLAAVADGLHAVATGLGRPPRVATR